MRRILHNWRNTFSRTDTKPVLGRWNIDHSNKVIDRKVDLSNEDHCGPCGQYIMVKREEQIKNQPKPSLSNKPEEGDGSG